MAWNEDEVEGARILWYINGVSTLLSLVGSVYMIYSCWKIPSPRNVSMKLILCLALSDFLYTVSNLMSQFEGDEEDLFCTVEALVRMNGYFNSLYFTAGISILCYQTSKYGPSFDQETFFRWAVTLGPIGYFIYHLAPFFTTKVGYVNGAMFCFINYTKEVTETYQKVIVRFLFEGIPVLVSIFVSFYGYVGTVIKLRTVPKSILQEMKIDYMRLFWYPGVMILICSPSVIDNLISASIGRTSPFHYKAIHLMLTHSIGFINATIYSVQKKAYMRQALKQEGTERKEKDELDLSRQRFSSLDNELLRANISGAL